MANITDYISFLAKKKLKLTEEEYLSYNYLLNELIGIEFSYTHPMDENRAIDGLELRKDFEFYTGKHLGANIGLIERCTVLEMMVALSFRCEHQIMRSIDAIDRTKKWFFMMLDNLELSEYTNTNWEYGSEEVIRKKIDVFLSRKIDKNGNGGMFPLKNTRKNQKNEQIWNQLMAYLRENYINCESDDLVLYSVDDIS